MRQYDLKHVLTQSFSHVISSHSPGVQVEADQSLFYWTIVLADMVHAVYQHFHSSQRPWHRTQLNCRFIVHLAGYLNLRCLQADLSYSYWASAQASTTTTLPPKVLYPLMCTRSIVFHGFS